MVPAATKGCSRPLSRDRLMAQVGGQGLVQGRECCEMVLGRSSCWDISFPPSGRLAAPRRWYRPGEHRRPAPASGGAALVWMLDKESRMARILIVDDEEMERVLLTAALEGVGHELFYAGDGKGAYDLCRSKDLDLVITDLAMPESSGLRLIKELREHHFNVPIIAVSWWAADQLDLARDYGADFVLCKPLDRKGFLATVEEALELRRMRPSDSWQPWD